MALAQHSSNARADELSVRPSPRPAAPRIRDADPATILLEKASAAINGLRQQRIRLDHEALERQKQFGAQLAAANETSTLWQRRAAIVSEQFDESRARLADLEHIIESATRRIDQAEASLTRFEQTSYNGNAAVHLYHHRILTVFGTLDLD